MKHSSSRQLFNYWNTQRGDAPAPLRAAIDPAAIRHALGDVFILAADFVEEQRFRLAGTRLCALFGRELKGEALSSLFADASRVELREALHSVTAERAVMVAGVRGRTAEDDSADLELLLLPLAHQGLARIRAIGVLAPAEKPYWLGAKPIKEMTLGTIRHIGSNGDLAESPSFVPASGEGRLRRGFMVYQGGLMHGPNEKAG